MKALVNRIVISTKWLYGTRAPEIGSTRVPDIMVQGRGIHRTKTLEVDRVLLMSFWDIDSDTTSKLISFWYIEYAFFPVILFEKSRKIWGALEGKGVCRRAGTL